MHDAPRRIFTETGAGFVSSPTSVCRCGRIVPCWSRQIKPRRHFLDFSTRPSLTCRRRGGRVGRVERHQPRRRLPPPGRRELVAHLAERELAAEGRPDGGRAATPLTVRSRTGRTGGGRGRRSGWRAQCSTYGCTPRVALRSRPSLTVLPRRYSSAMGVAPPVGRGRGGGRRHRRRCAPPWCASPAGTPSAPCPARCPAAPQHAYAAAAACTACPGGWLALGARLRDEAGELLKVASRWTTSPAAAPAPTPRRSARRAPPPAARAAGTSQRFWSSTRPAKRLSSARGAGLDLGGCGGAPRRQRRAARRPSPHSARRRCAPRRSSSSRARTDRDCATCRGLALPLPFCPGRLGGRRASEARGGRTVTPPFAAAPRGCPPAGGTALLGTTATASPGPAGAAIPWARPWRWRPAASMRPVRVEARRAHSPPRNRAARARSRGGWASPRVRSPFTSPFCSHTQHVHVFDVLSLSLARSLPV